MNLALLDPFRRQIPDRIDSTLSLPRRFHPRRPRSRLGKGTETENGEIEVSLTTRRSSCRKKSSNRNAINSMDVVSDDDVFDGENDELLDEDLDIDEEKNIWHSCFTVAFNRRGTYLASGHASGAVPIHHFASRTLSSIVHPPELGSCDRNAESGGVSGTKTSSGDKENVEEGMPATNSSAVPADADSDTDNNKNAKLSHLLSNNLSSASKHHPKANHTSHQSDRIFKNGITSVSWSRRSRACLIVSYSDNHVCLVDNTHPYGPDDASQKLVKGSIATNASSPHNCSTAQTNSSKHHSDDLDEEKNEDETTMYHEPRLKHTRYVSSLEILDPKNVTFCDIIQSTFNNQANLTMSALEMTIDLKPMSQRTVQERDLHEMIKAKISESSDSMNKAASKQKKNVSNHDDDTQSPKRMKTTHRNKLRVHTESECDRYQNIVIALPKPVSASAQIHPNGLGGLLCLDDGTLALFGLNEKNAFHISDQSEVSKEGKDDDSSSTSSPLLEKAKLIYLVTHPNENGAESNHGSKQMFVTCATFDPNGKYVYAATNCGSLLGFQLNTELEMALFNTLPKGNAVIKGSILEATRPVFKIKIPGGSTATQIVCSRNGKMILINSKDNALRLYNTSTIWQTVSKELAKMEPEQGNKSNLPVLCIRSIQPLFSFQDIVSRCKWASCDFSGDGEYVVGGCNNHKYELYLWNTATGMLLDQLTGPQISLHSLSWHPTRSFIAVGTSDGLVDIWGPRMDWTPFAPDFQALQKNVEYVEKEDEFDAVIDGDEDEVVKRQELTDKIEEKEFVDVTSIDTVPAFDSDSECEEDTFSFQAKIRSNFVSKGRGSNN